MTALDAFFARRSSAEHISATILSGFLGAGKTTLLNRILKGDHGLRIAVLVNDFGAVNIDAELVASAARDIVQLTNGCICCAMRGDLVEALCRVVDSCDRLDHVVIETSGVSEPAGVVMTFNSPAVRDHIALEGVLCVVDAETVMAAPETTQLKLRQMACADLILLNKTETAGPRQVEAVRQWLDGLFYRPRVIETNYCDLPMALVLGAGVVDARRRRPAGSVAFCDEATSRTAGASDAFESWSYETDRPLRLDAVRSAVSSLPRTVYRAKGVIESPDSANGRAVLQVVGRRVEIEADGACGGSGGRTKIALIGARGATDQATITRLFDDCAYAGNAGAASARGQ